MMNMMMKKKAL